MIDIVFQLIAFFVFALSFEAVDLTARIAPPVWSDVEPRRDVAAADVLIELDADGSLVAHDGRLIAAGGPEFDGAVEAALQGLSPGGLLIVRADQTADYRHVDDVLQICRRKGITQIGLRLRKPMDQ